MTHEIALVLAGAAAAGFVQGISGFAFGLIATAVWAPVLPPQQFVPLLVICSLFGQLLTIRRMLPHLDLRLAAPMVLGGLCGVPIGIWLLRRIDPVAFKAVVGAILAVYCPAMLFAARLPRFTGGGGWADAAAGLVGGVMGGLGGLNGPAPTLWCALRGWERNTQRAVFQTFILFAHTFTLVGFAIAGTLGAEVGRLSLYALPAMLLPNLLGVALYARISDVAFRRVVLLLLFATGIALLLSTVPVLLARHGPGN